MDPQHDEGPAPALVWGFLSADEALPRVSVLGFMVQLAR